MLLGALAPTAGTARAAHRQRRRILELAASAPHRVGRDRDRVGDDPHPTRSQLTRLATQPQPALTLGQVRLDRVIATGQGLHDRRHSTNGSHSEAEN